MSVGAQEHQAEMFSGVVIFCLNDQTHFVPIG